jgi:transcriptional regulator with XRE-family HTH domain
LLAPQQIKRIRERTGLTAVAIAHCLGVGDKTYTRWETGRSLQNKANDTLIRILDKNVELVALVNAERDPQRDVFIKEYMGTISSLKTDNELAMAAHGADLGTVARQNIRKTLQAIKSKEKAIA